MESGTYIPFGDITDGQQYYDALVQQTGCSNSTDTLTCLREVPFEQLMIAVNASPSIMSFQSIILAWVPRADGIFMPDSFQRALIDGKVADVPLITGDVDDEGTIFSLAALNISTDEDFRKYTHTIFFPQASPENIDTLARLYPEDPALGSPFDTGFEGAFTPQFKRTSAFIGDLIFQGPRRFFSQLLSEKQNVWSFIFKRNKLASPFGTQHGADLGVVYQPGDLTDNVVNFINHLDPNGRRVDQNEITWPRYTKSSPRLLSFVDGSKPQVIITDTFRSEAIAFLTNLTLEHPLASK
ncbi:hypothetical protein QCA50_008081 [Cerrena zonata]|uniref:Carboxylesterase type B domain-containing protein n=1 Tax=Cerrena zonata TaxID=2478898 RepID=A0AAW0G5J7_9APHY